MFDPKKQSLGLNNKYYKKYPDRTNITHFNCFQIMGMKQPVCVSDTKSF